MRKAKVPRGQYRFPYADAKQMQSPEMKKKMSEGPSGFLLYWDRWDGSMGKSLGQWFVYLLGVSIFVAYLTGRVLPAGAPSLASLSRGGHGGRPRLRGGDHSEEHLVGTSPGR